MRYERLGVEIMQVDKYLDSELIKLEKRLKMNDAQSGELYMDWRMLERIVEYRKRKRRVIGMLLQTEESEELDKLLTYLKKRRQEQ